MSSLSDWVDRILRNLIEAPTGQDIVDRIDEMDRQGREIRHDLKNVQQRGNALRRLVEKMRDDETWQQGRPDGRV